jgi:hypothetical protein
MASSQHSDKLIDEHAQSRHAAAGRRLPTGEGAAFELIDHPAPGSFEVICKQGGPSWEPFSGR